ncbi:hypothetical protein D3C83_231920 [compost metagenome]
MHDVAHVIVVGHRHGQVDPRAAAGIHDLRQARVTGRRIDGFRVVDVHEEPRFLGCAAIRMVNEILTLARLG